MAKDWNRDEVETIVAAYFQMLEMEQLRIPYRKSEVRRRILPLLNNRSESSIEFKNRNISAVLARIGQPYVRGYLPAYNYQRVLLEEVVFGQLRRTPGIEEAFRRFAEDVPEPRTTNFETIEESIPARTMILEEPELMYRSPVKVNYIAIEQANRHVGKVGESIALSYERWRLIRAGKESLADRIEWVSQRQGDGLGYDILSRNTNGTDRYIEVKATKLTKEAPFFFSALEYDFSKRNRSSFFLYRVFNLQADPKLFIAGGAYDEFCNLKATEYRGNF